MPRRRRRPTTRRRPAAPTTAPANPKLRGRVAQQLGRLSLHRAYQKAHPKADGSATRPAGRHQGLVQARPPRRGGQGKRTCSANGRPTTALAQAWATGTAGHQGLHPPVAKTIRRDRRWKEGQLARPDRSWCGRSWWFTSSRATARAFRPVATWRLSDVRQDRRLASSLHVATKWSGQPGRQDDPKTRPVASSTDYPRTRRIAGALIPASG